MQLVARVSTHDSLHASIEVTGWQVPRRFKGGTHYVAFSVKTTVEEGLVFTGKKIDSSELVIEGRHK